MGVRTACAKNMSQSQCPKCYAELEVREASPCFVCGCWLNSEELREAVNKNDFAVYGLTDGTEIILCKLCHLEEVLSNQGGLLNDLAIRKEEAEASVRFLDHAEALVTKDKYCTECDKRLSLLKVTACATKS